MRSVCIGAAQGIRFRVRGDGKSARVMLFSQSKGLVPIERTFATTSEWTEITLPFAAFDGIDGHDVLAIIFSGGPTTGAFAFQLDDVRIQ